MQWMLSTYQEHVKPSAGDWRSRAVDTLTRVFLGDRAGQRQFDRMRGLVAGPVLGRRQRLIREQRQQARVGDLDRIEWRAVPRAAHQYEISTQARGERALLRKRREVPLGRNHQHLALQTVQPIDRGPADQRAAGT